MLPPGQVERFHEQIVNTYRRAFREPPYNRTEVEVLAFENSFSRHIQREDFRFAGAIENASEQMVGFTYGYTSQPGQWWYEQVSRALGPQAAKEWLTDSFQLVELAVAPKAQGQGYGGRLHDLLMTGLPHLKAVLSTIAKDTVAYHLYLGRGWVDILDEFQFPGVGRPYRIMGLDLDGGGNEVLG